jgi:hypothetical protein
VFRCLLYCIEYDDEVGEFRCFGVIIWRRLGCHVAALHDELNICEPFFKFEAAGAAISSFHIGRERFYVMSSDPMEEMMLWPTVSIQEPE